MTSSWALSVSGAFVCLRSKGENPKNPGFSWALTETYVGDPEQCSRMDDSPDDPGISNAWDSSDSCGASGGGPNRGA